MPFLSRECSSDPAARAASAGTGPVSENPSSPVLAISATFTAEPIAEPIAFWMEELGLDYRVRFAPYNQVFQQLLDPAGLLAANRNGVNVLLVRLEDWARSGAALEENVRQFVTGLETAANSFASPLLVIICPASAAFLADPVQAGVSRKAEALIEAAVQPLSTVHAVTPAEIDRLYPVEDVHDPHANELGHVPYSPEFFTALGTLVARRIHALRRAPYKVIVLDCDDTLWGGICGEDGPEGVVLEPGRRVLHEFMLAQRDAGALLCLCSKNNEEDVIETFRAHPEMPLQLEHFIGWRINWEPKSSNLNSLADELELGLDSFIFIDDNRKECAEVQANCSDVLCLALPSDPGNIPEFVRDTWAFDRLKATREDRERAAMYSQKAERARLEKKATNLEEFLAALKLEIRIGEMTPEQLPRVSQLTHRTNQMNFTTIRRSESEIQNLLRSGGAECLTVHVSDRFGSYGLVGVMLFRSGPEAVELDTFLLSCRALGRGVEHRMLARLGELASERGLGSVDVSYITAARNRPALGFLEAVGAQYSEPTDMGQRFRFPAAYLKTLTYNGTNGAKSAPRQASAPRAEVCAAKRVDYKRIAEISQPAQVLEVIRGQKRKAAAPKAGSAAPRTELEKRLVDLWAELLHLPSVGIDDNFFDLGGHSLLAVQLLSRVRQAFGVEVSLEVVYSGSFTVAELAKAIEVREIEQAGADEYSALLAELDGLSDEEVRAMLEQEQRGEAAL